MKPKASKRCIKHLLIYNIKGSEKKSWYLPVYLIPGVPEQVHNSLPIIYSGVFVKQKKALKMLKGQLLDPSSYVLTFFY